MPSSPTPHLEPFLLSLAGFLLEHGCSTHRLEEVIELTANLYGVQAEVFAVPTGVWMSLVWPDGEVRTRMMRVHRWTVDLGALTAADRTFNEVLAGELDLLGGYERLTALRAAPKRVNDWWGALAGSVASGAAAVLFGGGWLEAIAGALLGGLALVIGAVLGRRRSTRLLMDFFFGVLTGCGAGGVMLLAAHHGLPVQPKAVFLGGLIVFVPGLTLTAGLSELAHKNLVSGTARLLDAIVVLLLLLSGVAGALALLPPVGLEAIPRPVLPSWQIWLSQGFAILLAGGAFLALFSVPRPQWLWALLGCFVAWLGEKMGASMLTHPAAGAFSATLCLGVYANALARIKDRPSQVYLMPGLILLVPGAFGFISFSQLLRGEVAGGVSGIFTTLVLSSALVLGLLVANAALSPRKLL